MATLVGVGAKIAKAREYQRPSLTQSQLAEQVGVSRDALAKYETGKNRVPDDVLRSVAKATGYPISWFLDGVNSPVPPLPNAVMTEMTQRPVLNLVRYLGTVPAGDWEMPTGDDWDYIEVSDTVDPEGVVAVRVAGNSMSPTLRHGQVVCIKESKHPRDGVISLARSRDGDLTLKVLTHTVDDGWELRSINPAYGTVGAESWEIMGYAIHVEENDPAGLRP